MVSFTSIAGDIEAALCDASTAPSESAMKEVIATVGAVSSALIDVRSLIDNVSASYNSIGGMYYRYFIS